MQLPYYLNLKTFEKEQGPDLKGYSLAIWDCGRRFPGRTWWDAWKDIRITIRKKGVCWFVIKKGAE